MLSDSLKQQHSIRPWTAFANDNEAKSPQKLVINVQVTNLRLSHLSFNL